ncbi:MAG: hypothetical protein BWZ10_02446 [candidate division BRC1 bacterium ADurb.BinA364]|nr:MAG: hypothetical protein BWZ10_02446 [candidate division BRC1 bacterium ADurb.BinA364]
MRAIAQNADHHRGHNAFLRIWIVQLLDLKRNGVVADSRGRRHRRRPLDVVNRLEILAGRRGERLGRFLRRHRPGAVQIDGNFGGIERRSDFDIGRFGKRRRALLRRRRRGAGSLADRRDRVFDSRFRLFERFGLAGAFQRGQRILVSARFQRRRRFLAHIEIGVEQRVSDDALGFGVQRAQFLQLPQRLDLLVHENRRVLNGFEMLGCGILLASRHESEQAQCQGRQNRGMCDSVEQSATSREYKHRSADSDIGESMNGTAPSLQWTDVSSYALNLIFPAQFKDYSAIFFAPVRSLPPAVDGPNIAERRFDKPPQRKVSRSAKSALGAAPPSRAGNIRRVSSVLGVSGSS